MADVRFEQLLGDVRPYAPGAPIPAMVVALRNACIEFCKAAPVLQRDLSAITSQDERGDYEINVAAGYVVSQVVALYYSGVQIYPTSKSVLQNRRDNWRLLSGTPQCFLFNDPTYLTLVPRPLNGEARALTGQVALAPARDADAIDEDFFDGYAEELAAGALARLLRTPSVAYSNPALGETYYKQFRGAIAQAVADVNGGGAGTNAELRVQFRRF